MYFFFVCVYVIFRCFFSHCNMVAVSPKQLTQRSEQMSSDEYVFSNKCVGFNSIMRCMRIKYRENFHSLNDNNNAHRRDLTKNHDFVWFTCHNFRCVLDFAAWVLHANHFSLQCKTASTTSWRLFSCCCCCVKF